MTKRAGGILLLGCLLAASSGCASSRSGASTGTRWDILTLDEILGVEANHLYDVIARLRPRWLEGTGPEGVNEEVGLAVFRDEVYVGGPQALREMSTELVLEVRYLNETRAALELPRARGVDVPAIVVRTRPSRD